MAAPVVPRHILILQGHPERGAQRLCHALARAYANGAREGGHQTETIDIADLDFPLLHSKQDWEHGTPPAPIVQVQAAIARADHLVLIYPLWLGCMPALLKGFLEQVLRPGFAISPLHDGMPRKLLQGKSARIVVTMGMPGPVYRWYFGAHSLKSLKRNILGFCGVSPIRDLVVGMVESASEEQRQQWLRKLHQYGLGAM
ncbi:MAG TPA: NAD(P)H-dependent oxidoreductase [Nevskiaceae bacterium]|nr:NAD(P)H-dependent oxidoreductase [Nevskiaceae bacterium]